MPTNVTLPRSLAALLGVLAPLLVAVPSQAAEPTAPRPQDDPFYASVPGLAAMANGTVIRTRAIDASIEFATQVKVPTTSWQIAYKSLDALNQPIPNVTTLVVPTKAWTGKGPRPVVAYQAAEDSTGQQCAPSYSLRTNSNLLTGVEESIMASALDRGFAMAISDHEGPNSAFLAGPQSAHLILDGIRAVQGARLGGVSRANPVGLWGYSGGGHATGWAAEQARSYAPDLTIAGAAFGGAPLDLSNSARMLDGSLFSAFAIAGLVGLTHAYPTWDVRKYLNDRGREAFDQADQKCIAEFGPQLAFKRFSDLSTVPDILAVPSVAAVTNRTRLGQATPSMPVHLYFTPLDEAIPFADSLALVKRYCSAGVRVSTDVQAVSEHVTLAVSGSGGALDFLGDRFAGRTTPRDC